jgi:hypothetical protein
MADWSNLPKDVVHVVADLLLATNDVDCYVDMRAVCRNWRVTVPKPTPLGAGDDGRFRPSEWVMLDEKEPEDGVDGRLFLHVSTGRFVRRRLPSFGFDSRSKYILVGSSDGLLILGDQKGLHAARLLNPFTGDSPLLRRFLGNTMSSLRWRALARRFCLPLKTCSTTAPTWFIVLMLLARSVRCRSKSWKTRMSS